jgi:uncharacterized protein (DUF488 family)
MATLTTIGYEQATLPRLVATLEANKVELLVDVRAIAASRRPGFAKSQLKAGVEAAGIGYLHLRGLGTPAAGREAVRAGRPAAMRPIYEAHLKTPEAGLELAGLAQLIAEGRRVCLLCLERDPAHCHRAILAERLARELDLPVTHLFVEPDPVPG